MATERTFGDLVPLGDGPSATVFAGVHENAAFALKVYPGRLDRGTRSQLDSELAALTAVRGRAPVLVADAVQSLPDGRCALRMELCAQSLPELIGAFGPMTAGDALGLGRSLATALAAAHAAGQVHGGVTPGNVLFRASGEAVLSDFGLTLRRAFPREPGHDFLAPETLRDGTADERSDLYGLGAVLYLALSGRSPHQGRPGEQEGELVLRVLREPVPPLDRHDLPAGLGALVASLLAKDPDARPLDAATVAARLGTVLGPPPPAAGGAAFDDFAAAGWVPRVPVSGQPWPPQGQMPVPVPQGQAPVMPQAVPAAQPPSTHGFPPPGAPAFTPAPAPHLGEPLVVYGPDTTPRRRPRRTASFVAALAGLSILAIAAVLLLVNTPEELDVPEVPPVIGAPTLTAPPSRAVQLILNEPVDQGDYVELSWQSSEALDFALVVAAEGQETATILVQRNTTYRLRVDPVLKYCFQIKGTDGGPQIFESQVKPFRGASCVS
ncbi:hypothetical protein GCM10027445_64540 [Amycolatopsis endophytica]|nr:protein kinase [Amycolatopsis endophytica]